MPLHYLAAGGTAHLDILYSLAINHHHTMC
jgi:hypothetical protein